MGGADGGTRDLLFLLCGFDSRPVHVRVLTSMRKNV